MRNALLATLTLVLLGCPAGGGTPMPGASTIAGAEVDVTKVVVSAPTDGAVSVTGKPGAMKLNGYKVTTVTITILREAPSPAPAYQLLHLAGALPIASGFASVAADGSFTETWLGDSGRPVLVKDEVNFTPQNGVAQAGFPTWTTVL